MKYKNTKKFKLIGGRRVLAIKWIFFSRFGLKWKDCKGKDISNFNFRHVNLVSFLNTRIIFLKGVYNHHTLSGLQEWFTFFLKISLVIERKENSIFLFLLNMLVKVLSYWWNDVLHNLGYCLLIWKRPKKKMTVNNFGKHGRGNGGMYLNHIKSWTWVFTS